jgi:uncharacterized protein YfkK (UPF0435 family)
MKNKKDQERFSLKDQFNSIQIDMFQLELMKTLNLINQSLNNNSKLKSAELEDIDLHRILFYLNIYSITFNNINIFILLIINHFTF